jgi:DNA-binding winged helix-turn-helix (wHTH) protein
MELLPLKYFDSLYPDTTRRKEIQLLIPFLEKGLSSQLIGLPGTGKSNILRLLSYNREVRFKNFGEYEKFLHFTYIDCSEIKGRPLLDITKFILLSLSFSLGERRLIEESKKVNEFLEEGLKLHDELILFQSLKKSLDYLSIEKKLTVNLLFDRFESILPNIDSQFFTNLKILRNNAKYRFGSIFSLTRPLEELVEPTLLADFHDLIIGNEIYISLFDPIGIDFRISYIEKAVRETLKKGLKEQVLSLTGGHSKLTKLSIEAVIAEKENPENLEEFLLKKSALQGALFEIWNALLPGEQLAIKNNISYEEALEKHPYLVNSGLITLVGISIPLFKKYIQSVSVDSSEKITLDEDKNEILFGVTKISDKLSPSEFKLLKFLIQNKEKLLTKDEIISAIWSEQKSQEGVTDQALDQIFYRLRKKVELDSTNPHYIHTIKGKGYRLTD